MYYTEKLLVFFLFNVTAITEMYTYLHTLSLHDALPIYVLQHGHLVEHPRNLEGPSDPHRRDAVDRPVRDAAAAEGDGPAAGRVDPVDDVEKGGLAGAVRPDDALNLAFLDVEIDSVEHGKAAENLLQPPYLEQAHPTSEDDK